MKGFRIGGMNILELYTGKIGFQPATSMLSGLD